MNGASFRAGIRRGLQEAIEIVEWEERRWAPGAKPQSTVARTRHIRLGRQKGLLDAKARILAQLKRHERQHYARRDPFAGFAVWGARK